MRTQLLKSELDRNRVTAKTGLFDAELCQRNFIESNTPRECEVLICTSGCSKVTRTVVKDNIKDPRPDVRATRVKDSEGAHSKKKADRFWGEHRSSGDSNPERETS